MLPKIACCYHPTSVIFVDDNRSFLDNVLLDLDANINAISFTKPTTAIDYIKDHVLSSFTAKYLQSLQSDEDIESLNLDNIEHGYVDVDVFNIYKVIYDSSRFDKAIVVVVDYTMPEMNGLELCKSLKEYPLKFILITGDATLNTTIEAFNNGLIHYFIPKSTVDFNSRLQAAIYKLQDKQFIECSTMVIRNLLAASYGNLDDSILINFVKIFFKENDIVEYYLINKSGCFLTVTADGKLNWFIIKNENEMAEYESAAIDNYAKKEVVDKITSREHLLFLNSEDDHVSVAVEDWINYLYPATKLNGEHNTYYYSFIPQQYNKLCEEEIVFYNDHLMSQ